MTVNAAYSLGVLDEVGTLEPGKRADLLITNVEHYQMLAFELGVPLVDQVVVDGKVVHVAGGASCGGGERVRA